MRSWKLEECRFLKIGEIPRFPGVENLQEGRPPDVISPAHLPSCALCVSLLCAGDFPAQARGCRVLGTHNFLSATLASPLHTGLLYPFLSFLLGHPIGISNISISKIYLLVPPPLRTSLVSCPHKPFSPSFFTVGAPPF